MYRTLRPLIFLLQPEDAHRLTLALLRLSGNFAPARALLKWIFTPAQSRASEVQAFGVVFPNPIGMAAGYDKDGLAWRGLACLGFGHIEVGTVTPHPQPGTPEPRIFRLADEEAVINRMGFPNRGAEFLARRLNKPRSYGVVMGVNIGKNKETPLEIAALDYLSLLRTFAPLADYLAINVSSPNTPGLRKLQARHALEDLLTHLNDERRVLRQRLGKKIPLLVKLAPDLSDTELDSSLEAILATGMDGVILANTTFSRDGVHSPLAGEEGGLSGAPLRKRSTAMVRRVAGLSGDKLPIVASGGVMTPADAREKLDAGARLVQIYTGMIYAGPGLVKQILNHL
jgi:dihydroorotate dehydrogenase